MMIKKPPNFTSWAQTYEGGHRWGIMTSNGSKALNSFFRVERTLLVTAIMEETWYKCVKCFDKREMEVLNLHRACKQWPKKLMTSWQNVTIKQVRVDIILLYFTEF
jgi:hypothetical protein